MRYCGLIKMIPRNESKIKMTNYGFGLKFI